jgi:hypothetical protein
MNQTLAGTILNILGQYPYLHSVTQIRFEEVAMNVLTHPTTLFRPLAGLTLALGVVGAPVLATTAMAQQVSSDTQTLAASRVDTRNESRNGVYLFGETPAPEQIGSGYMVMEVEGSTVVGALYMPHSSFDCFQGELEGDRLNLSVTNSYDLSTHAYSMNLNVDGAIASINPTAVPVELEGYHLIPSVSNTDLRLLETCKANL